MTSNKGTRASATATMATALLLTSSGMAVADVPQNVPNSGASHNCVATSSGVLYFRENGIRLGRDVSNLPRTAASESTSREHSGRPADGGGPLQRTRVGVAGMPVRRAYGALAARARS
jgi:hypothetical protein